MVTTNNDGHATAVNDSLPPPMSAAAPPAASADEDTSSRTDAAAASTSSEEATADSAATDVATTMTTTVTEERRETAPPRPPVAVTTTQKDNDEHGFANEGNDGKSNNTSNNNNNTDPKDELLSSTVEQHRRTVSHTSLEDNASIVSRWLLSYLSPLLKVGATKVLDQQDVGVPSKRDRADAAFETALRCWTDEVSSVHVTNDVRKAKYEAKMAKLTPDQRKKIKPFRPTEPSVAKSLFKGFGRLNIAIAIGYYVISALLAFVPVLLLNDLVKYFEAGAPSDYDDGYAPPWLEVVGLGVLPLIISLLQTRHQTIMAHCAVFTRTAVSTLLYQKSLRVSAAGRARTSTGQVVNMMSNDTAQLQRFLQFAGMTLVAPLQIVVSLVLIYGQVGNATWVGVGFMVFLAPINIVVFSVVGKMRRKVLKYSDLRVKMMNEILAGIRIIKFYAWEQPFGKEVGKLRDKELQALTNLAYTSAVGFSLILLSAPIIQPILVFLTYINIQDEPLSAATAFTTVALFNIMRFPFAFLPMGMLQFIQSRISLRRLATYLQLPELEEYVLSVPHPDDVNDDPNSPPGPGAQVGSVTMKDCSFTWVHPDANTEPLEKTNEKKKGRMSRKERRASQRLAKEGGGDNGTNGGNKGKLGSDHTNSSYVSLASLNISVDENANGPKDTVALRDVSCTIPAGSLVAVVGTVGSGKSSFLSAMLGEMEPLHGSKVYVPRHPDQIDMANFVSYAAQTPWVVNDTLRGNILFGRPFRQERYDKVVQACALLDDLRVLPAGDQTEIGERGINLSGGQKARVSLARAMYSTDTKLLLLDDPLSAVDAHVGEHLFREAISGSVSRGATRVLVTHHVHFLPRCDAVIVLDGGRIKHMGTYDDLIEQGVDFAGAVDVSKAAEESGGAVDGGGGEGSTEAGGGAEGPDVAEKATDAVSSPSKSAPATSGAAAKGSLGKTTEDAEARDDPDATKAKAEMKKRGATLVKDEEREEGSVSGSAYVHYANAGGMISFLLIFIVQGLGRGSEIMASFWLAIWAEETIDAVMDGDPLTDSETSRYLNIYAAFGMFGVFCLTIRALVMAVHRLRASRKLHNDLTDSILRAPVAFFDVTPTGRVLNRFAADMDKVDLELTQSLGQGVSTVFSVLGAMGAIVAATKGTFLVPLVPIGYVYYVIQKWFRKTSTELQRVTSIANSPIFADFSQTLSGTSTIRAFGEQQRFFKQCQNSFNNFNASYILVQLTNYWLGLRLDILGGLIGAFIGGVAVATASSEFIPAGWVGLALSYAIEVTGFLKHGVRMIATVEAEMNSVERILFYSENIDSEAADVTKKDPRRGDWPSKGKIEIEAASMRYRDGPLVLKKITVTVEGGEKVGVVGRTGSGKSSLMNALFRITELENDGGKIVIDGVRISDIGTNALRLNLSIIPQDPVMFSNTVRYNLDPFGTATETELWEVLKKVQLAEAIAVLPGGLDEQVAEGGENFSQGQRQLLCIARSLLRHPKILIMDEATASIDNTTDAAIQKMIRENFSDATVLTIAHRLNTIMDSDRVLVLDDGHIAEFDTPSALLQKDGGLFRAMVEKSKKAHKEVVDEA